ncbi:hypothetical protein [Saccharomonospora sp. CUA-673]|uniref:hypothetical protein n=1 Tax=Saccharomonospora sp. CUA-673 TaxID=1904969 RepID=UPI001C9E5F05|nr:hypothetical protein [Saccharomonospora sp. CUA-673]
MTRAHASGTERGTGGDAAPKVPVQRKLRRFAPGLVISRPGADSDSAADVSDLAGMAIDDRRLTSRYVVRL